MKPTLAEIVEHKKLEVAERQKLAPFDHLKESVKPGRGNFVDCVSRKRINVIAELKPKSPSAGVLKNENQLDVESIVKTYDKYAAAISVLTDQKYFGGSLSLLAHVVAGATVPVLCKDFVVDPYQVYEARAAGAQAVLLIVKILADDLLADLLGEIKNLGMTAVIEVQTPQEVERALRTKPELLLINNRDLSTFQVDLATSELLAGMIPEGLPFISASGIETAADISRLLPLTNRFLVGSSIMRAANLEQKLQELCEVPAPCAN